MATHAQRRDATRRRILNAAAALFAKRGFTATSVAAIARRARVVKQTFYQHFDGKMDVLVMLGREQGAGQVQQLLVAVAEGASAVVALERYYLALAQWFEAQAPIARDIIISAIRLHDPLSNRPELYAHDFTKAVLRAAQQQGEVRDDISAEVLATVIGGAFTLAVVDWSCQPKAGRLTAAFSESLCVFLHGASAPLFRKEISHG